MPVKSRVVIALALVGLSLFLFIHLASEVVEGDAMSYDRAILLALRVPGKPWLPIGPHWLLAAVTAFTALGSRTNLTLITALVAAYLFAAKRPAAAAFVIGAVTGGALLSGLLKVAFERPRPLIVPHLIGVNSPSFPSGHALNASVTFLTLGLLLAKTEQRRAVRIYLISAATLLSILIGCSRVYLGVHWPSDVLAGWCVGGAWALACALVADRFQRRRSSPTT